MNQRASIALLLAAFGCGPAPSAGGEPGMETGPCIEHQCLGSELQCLSNLCVDPHATPDASSGDGDGDGDGDDDDEADDGDSDDTAGPGGGPVTSVSVLFVIDNSGSMAEEQAILAYAIGSLTDPLEASGFDWRLGITTTDMGNPWCDGTLPERGTLVASSCRSRTQDFVFNGAVPIDATQEACLDVCSEQWPSIDLPVPWIESIGGATNLPTGLDLQNALRCMLPQGINGCGFEQPLESTHLAVQRATMPGDLHTGFLPDGALLAVIVMTDEVDCSHAPGSETIFLPDGNRVFWSDPAAVAPSSAVCWNAGVQCTGGPGTYGDCQPADFDFGGVPTGPDSAVLLPVSRYIDQLSSRPAVFAAISGVPAGYATGGAEITYAQAQDDPDFQLSFGIGPGCESSAGRAVPPVRIRAVAEAIDPGARRLYSICDANLGPALSSIAEGILDAAQP